MAFDEVALKNLPEPAMLSVAARAVLRAEPAVWSAAMLHQPSVPIAREHMAVLMHMAGCLGLLSALKNQAALEPALEKLAKHTFAALTMINSWLREQKSTIPESHFRAWQDGLAAAGIVAVVASGDHNFVAERCAEAIDMACGSLACMGFDRALAEARVDEDIAAAAQLATSGSPAQLEAFLTGSVWRGHEPQGVPLAVALDVLRDEHARCPVLLPELGLAIGPEELVASGRGDDVEALLDWLTELQRGFDSSSAADSSEEIDSADDSSADALEGLLDDSSDDSLNHRSDDMLGDSSSFSIVDSSNDIARRSPGWVRRMKPFVSHTARRPPPIPTTLVSERGYVNTGFATNSRPDLLLGQDSTLHAGTRHWLCVEIGELLAGIAEGSAVRIDPSLLPDRAELDVLVFTFPGGLQLVPDAERGRLELGGDGVGRVLRQPCEGVGKHLAKLRRKLEDPSLLGTRLFFPVRTGDAPEQRIRVSIYFRHVLVHSRVISVRTSAGRESSEAAISFRTDYLLTRRLDPAKLADIGEHDLSLMLNGDDDGGHQLRIFGREAVCEDVHFPPLALEEIIAEIRGAMRLAAWGSKEEWDGQKRFDFRYTDMGAANRRALHLAQLREDLFRMARVGRRSFDQIRRPVNMVLRRTAPEAKLEALLDQAAFVQFASRASATELIPLAGLYQLPLDPNLSQYRLCPTFERTLETGATLEGSDCWQGRCMSAAMDVVCPSGFWGFRHYLGVPVTLGDSRESELPPSLGCVGAPRVTAAVSTDENFERRESHLAELRALLPDPDCLLVAKTRDQAIAAMQSNPGHVVYFYCHGGRGGINGNVPALLVGPNDSPWIDASLISQVLEGRWQPQGPLVVLNGCRTTAVLPSQAFDLVTAFVQDAGAAGVIGTEITLYEELAASFATAFIRALLVDKVELGVAVRRARLALLADCNPLGLVYTSFALSRLRLSP